MPSVGEWERVVCFLFWRGGAEVVDRAFTPRRQGERRGRSIGPLPKIPPIAPWEKKERSDLIDVGYEDRHLRRRGFRLLRTRQQSCEGPTTGSGLILTEPRRWVFSFSL